MSNTPTVIESIYNKHLEIHYNKKTIITKDGPVTINLKGKIVCPILNAKITPVVCAKFMDTVGWPRAICPSICASAECFINTSIQSNKKRVQPNDSRINK